jgi:hypothetical protein
MRRLFVFAVSDVSGLLILGTDMFEGDVNLSFRFVSAGLTSWWGCVGDLFVGREWLAALGKVWQLSEK